MPSCTTIYKFDDKSNYLNVIDQSLKNFCKIFNGRKYTLITSGTEPYIEKKTYHLTRCKKVFAMVKCLLSLPVLAVAIVLKKINTENKQAAKRFATLEQLHVSNRPILNQETQHSYKLSSDKIPSIKDEINKVIDSEEIAMVFIKNTPSANKDVIETSSSEVKTNGIGTKSVDSLEKKVAENSEKSNVTNSSKNILNSSNSNPASNSSFTTGSSSSFITANEGDSVFVSAKCNQQSDVCDIQTATNLQETVHQSVIIPQQDLSDSSSETALKKSGPIVLSPQEMQQNNTGSNLAHSDEGSSFNSQTETVKSNFGTFMKNTVAPMAIKGAGDLFTWSVNNLIKDGLIYAASAVSGIPPEDFREGLRVEKAGANYF